MGMKKQRSLTEVVASKEVEEVLDFLIRLAEREVDLLPLVKSRNAVKKSKVYKISKEKTKKPKNYTRNVDNVPYFNEFTQLYDIERHTVGVSKEVLENVERHITGDNDFPILYNGEVYTSFTRLEKANDSIRDGENNSHYKLAREEYHLSVPVAYDYALFRGTYTRPINIGGQIYRNKNHLAKSYGTTERIFKPLSSEVLGVLTREEVMKGIPYRVSKYMEDVLQESIITNNVSNTYAEDSEISEVVDTNNPDDMARYVKRKSIEGVGEVGLPITLNGVTYISLKKALETHNISRQHHQNAVKIFKNLLNPSVFESLPRDLVINTILTHYKKLDVALDMSLDTRLWGYRETSKGVEYLRNFKDIQEYIYGFSTYTMCSTAIEKYKMLKGNNLYKVNLYDFYTVLAKTSRYAYGVYADNSDGIPSIITTRHLDKSDDIIAYTGELKPSHKKELQSTYIILTNLSQDIKRVCETLHKNSNIPVGKLGSEGNRVTEKVMGEAVIQTELEEVDVMNKYIVETSGSNVSLAENDEVRNQLQKVLDMIEKPSEKVQVKITRVEENKGIDKPSRNIIKSPKLKEVHEKVTSENLTTSLSQPVRVRGTADISKEKQHFEDFQEILKNTHIEDRLELLYTLLTKHKKKINMLADIKNGVPVLEKGNNASNLKATQEIVNNIFNMTLNVNFLPYANRYLSHVDIFRHIRGIAYSKILQMQQKGYIPYEGKFYKDVQTLFRAYNIEKEQCDTFRLLEPCDIPLHTSILLDYRVYEYGMKYNITLEGKVYKTLNDYAQDIMEEGNDAVRVPHIDSYVLSLLTEEEITRGIKKFLLINTTKLNNHLPSSSTKHVNTELYKVFYEGLDECIREGYLRDRRRIKEVKEEDNVLAILSNYFRKLKLPITDTLKKQPLIYTANEGYITDGRKYGNAMGVAPLITLTEYMDKVKRKSLNSRERPVVKKVDILNSLILDDYENQLYLNVEEKRWKVLTTGYINTKENIPYTKVMENEEESLELQRLLKQADKDLEGVYYITYTIREYLEDYFRKLNW